MSEELGYRKTFEKTFIRRKHLIKFSIGMTKTSLVNMINFVPNNATIDEVIEDSNGNISIEFHEEKIIR